MRNKYPGPCRWCGKTVEAGKGNVLGKPGAWEFSHDHCIPVYKPIDPEVRERCQEYDL